MDHDTDSLDCPCGPRFLLPCDECMPPAKEPKPGDCWKCGGNRLIAVNRYEAEESPLPVIIVHENRA